jgi:putative flippase GtrA
VSGAPDPEAAPGNWLSRLPLPLDFLRFLLAGGFAAAVNLLSRFLLTPVIGFEVSVVVAYLIGMVVAYCLFRWFIFASSGRSVLSETLRFVMVNIVALVLVWCVTVILARLLFPAVGFKWHADDVAHLIGVCVPAISSYIGHRKYTFGRADDGPA